jgi:predicted enzyme related to lactoylglutathione lyase
MTMGERTKYAPGTFSWTDLTTPDQDGAKAFYTALFGWESNEFPMGDDGAVYMMMMVGDKRAAAISPQPPQQAGAPPVWNSYVTVESADESVDRAKELGGTVHAPAFDVFDAGRMGVVQDPQGAYVCVWEPRDNIGAERVNGPGLMSWNELHTSDLPDAERFYSELFGWGIDSIETPGGEYRVITVDGHGNGALTDALQEDSPPHWIVYFGTDDLDASNAKISELGGTVVMPSMDVGNDSRVGVSRDAQGGWFALYEGRFED